MRLGDLLRRGLAAGAAAGLASAIMLWLVVEPVLRRALAVEDARTEAEHDAIISAGGVVPHEDPIVTRTEQVLGGMGTALIAGLLFGVVFAVVFARVRHLLPGAGDFGKSIALAALGFTVLVLAPMLTIPANPPAVGEPDSVDQRTMIFLLTVVLATLLVIAAFVLNTQLKQKGVSDAVRGSLVIVGVMVVTGASLLAIPNSPDSIASDMGAQIVWDFRLASVGMRAVLFAVLGVVFGLLVTRKQAAVEAREAVAA